MKWEKICMVIIIVNQVILLFGPLLRVYASPPLSPVTAEKSAEVEKIFQEVRSGKKSFSASEQANLFKQIWTLREDIFVHESSLRSVFSTFFQLSALSLALEGWLVWRYRKYLLSKSKGPE